MQFVCASAGLLVCCFIYKCPVYVSFIPSFRTQTNKQTNTNFAGLANYLQSDDETSKSVNASDYMRLLRTYALSYYLFVNSHATVKVVCLFVCMFVCLFICYLHSNSIDAFCGGLCCDVKSCPFDPCIFSR
jgi:hypothetical protein